MIAAAPSGCGVARRAPVIHRYVILASSTSENLPIGAQIRVGEVEGMPPFDQSGIAYQVAPYQLDTYRFSRGWLR
jgi:hypothetical protein